MRSMWKGDISFGLVNIPIAIIPVEENKDLHFHLLDPKTMLAFVINVLTLKQGRKLLGMILFEGMNLIKIVI